MQQIMSNLAMMAANYTNIWDEPITTKEGLTTINTTNMDRRFNLLQRAVPDRSNLYQDLRVVMVTFGSDDNPTMHTLSKKGTRDMYLFKVAKRLFPQQLATYMHASHS